MRNRTWSFLVIGMITLLLGGCSGNSRKQTNVSPETDSVNDVNEGVKTLRLQNVIVTWIRDNDKEHFMARTLFPEASDALMESLSLQDGVPASMSAFLVEIGGTRILFDTGVGGPDSRLLRSLRSLGIAPADIKYIYLTHFHGDHIGGMMKGDSVVFPNAEIYASKMEYDAWMEMPAEKNARVVKTMDAYEDHLHLFSFGDTLPGDVVALHGVGHTPGHTVFLAGKLLIIGDLIHGADLQLEHPEICATYDMDREEAVKTRKYYLQYAKDNQLTMAGMHLPSSAFWKD